MAYDTTLDNDERTLIENQIEQFLIFCILCSVNITSSEKTFFEKIIKPFFEGVKSDNPKKGIKGIFALSKKTLYKHSVIDRLFILQDIDTDESNKNINEDLIRTYKPGFDNNISINDNIAESEAGKKIKKSRKKEKKDKC